MLAVALALWLSPVFAEPNFPELTGRVVDDASLLSYPEEVAITADLKALEDKSIRPAGGGHAAFAAGLHHRGFRLSARPPLGHRHRRRWTTASLLIVAPNERKVRIEVGRGLEGTLTDALSKIIIENGILPRFREGDFAGGIKNGVRDLALVLTGDAAEVEAAPRPATTPTIR